MDDRDLIREARAALGDLEATAPKAPPFELVTGGVVRLEKAREDRRWWNGATAFAAATAAFALTVIAVGVVVFAFRGDGTPVATPAEETVDHVELRWEQTIDLRCEDMNVLDNGGFGEATIDIWGPNADGLVRVDATAPDGTVQTVIHTEQADDLTVERVWSSMGWEINDDEQIYRVAYCVGDAGGDTSRYHVTDLPISPRGHDFGMFVSLPAVSPTGTSLDIEAIWLENGATVVDGEWLGIPVRVYTQENTWTDSNGVETHRFDTWFDQTQRRFERQQHVTDVEALGTVTTNVEVVTREIVPADSVSFSTEHLALTWEAPHGPSDDVATVTTIALDPPTDSPWTDQHVADAAAMWMNQLGLNQQDPRVWRFRLDVICGEIGPRQGDADVEMERLAEGFVKADADLSVRADGTLPDAAEAAEALWIIAQSPTCSAAGGTTTTLTDRQDGDADAYEVEWIGVSPDPVRMGDTLVIRGQVAEPVPAEPLGLRVWLVRDETYDLKDLMCRTTPTVTGEFGCEYAIVEGGDYGAVSPGDYVLSVGEMGSVVIDSTFTIEEAAPSDNPRQRTYLVPPAGPSLEPPEPIFGPGRASGSGCPLDVDYLPDGIWFGYLLDVGGLDGRKVTFDPACMYFGQAAWDKAAESGSTAEGDIWIINDAPSAIELQATIDATAWMTTGDAAEGHQPMAFPAEWTGTESTYSSCPGESCGVWIYVNDGDVSEIVEQYLP